MIGYIALLILGVLLVVFALFRLSNWKDSYGFLPNLCIFIVGLAMVGYTANRIAQIIIRH